MLKISIITKRLVYITVLMVGFMRVMNIGFSCKCFLSNEHKDVKCVLVCQYDRGHLYMTRA